MTELRLIGGTALAEPAETRRPLRRCGYPPAATACPPTWCATHQRHGCSRRGAAALAEQGYGRLTAARVTELAGVSSRTFYQHFEDLWACLLAAYETEASLLCAGDRECLCGTGGGARPDRRSGQARSGAAGIAAALGFLAAEPTVARLLSAEPPPQIAALAAARRDLVERLGAMLRAVLESRAAPPRCRA